MESFPILFPTDHFSSSSSLSSSSASFVRYPNVIAAHGFGSGSLADAGAGASKLSGSVHGGGDQAPTDGLTKKKSAKEKKARKPRFAFQTRSQVDVLDDGYRWRKYGQKAVKNSKFARSYYRCTHQGCNVKKQVQRLSRDEGMVVTTYEGMHTHPIQKQTDNFEDILNQMQIYANF
ncbi:probable WRKY transcription factor 75 [Zingiber officinale]|uniref:WRKY domain-containing protein n=1 Tax=Zingiber officinale TaxID=94328 RepID=A0A8J5EWP2_ZINOF|nr:probable WRKY transcription factor 75 [Zingiber officinale]KAG6475835.1 hypothetical protein ZIOFF_065064 [Zingiber officinale]